jgi:hypothetical protein
MARRSESFLLNCGPRSLIWISRTTRAHLHLVETTLAVLLRRRLDLAKITNVIDHSFEWCTFEHLF